VKQVAWLGLGLIGLPMASRLAGAGFFVCLIKHDAGCQGGYR